MRIRKRPLRRMLLLTVLLCTVLVSFSYITGANNKDNILSKALNVFTFKNQKAEEDKKQLLAEQEQARREEEAKRKAEEAKLEQWKLDMEKDIKEFLGADSTKVGMVYYDIERDQKIAINEEKVFTAASTVKVQMNMIAYDKIKKGELSLDQEILYTSKDNAAGTGRLLADYKKTKPIPLSVLLDYSIKYSDNIATNMVLRTLGGSSKVRTIANEMAGTNTETKENKITAEEEFRLLKILYENREDQYNAHLIDVMKNTIFHDRLDKYLPQEIVAHKIGDYATYVNDVGIIFTEKPYILVVYSNELPGLGKFQPHEKIAELSKLIYEAHLKK